MFDQSLALALLRRYPPTLRDKRAEEEFYRTAGKWSWRFDMLAGPWRPR